MSWCLTVCLNQSLCNIKFAVAAGIANAPAASSLDALWAKLQQQHSQEAEAARMTRRAHSGSLPTDSTVNPGSSVQQAAPFLSSVNSAAGRSNVTGQTAATDGNSAPAAVHESAASQQQLSEAAFWNSMQK